jgi:hypothetical protein
MIKSLGSKLPKKRYTITHLGETLSPEHSLFINLLIPFSLQPAHSALAMTVMLFNPPSSQTASHTLNSWGLTDVRPLRPFSVQDSPQVSTLVTPILSIPVSIFLSDSGKHLPLDKHMLLRTLEVVRRIYVAENARPAVISEMGSVDLTDAILATR